MPLNILVIQDGQVDCPKENRKTKANDCISCNRLKMIQPRDGGEVWCRQRDTAETECTGVSDIQSPR